MKRGGPAPTTPPNPSGASGGKKVSRIILLAFIVILFCAGAALLFSEATAKTGDVHKANHGTSDEHAQVPFPVFIEQAPQNGAQLPLSTSLQRPQGIASPGLAPQQDIWQLLLPDSAAALPDGRTGSANDLVDAATVSADHPTEFALQAMKPEDLPSGYAVPQPGGVSPGESSGAPQADTLDTGSAHHDAATSGHPTASPGDLNASSDDRQVAASASSSEVPAVSRDDPALSNPQQLSESTGAGLGPGIGGPPHPAVPIADGTALPPSNGLRAELGSIVPGSTQSAYLQAQPSTVVPSRADSGGGALQPGDALRNAGGSLQPGDALGNAGGSLQPGDPLANAGGFSSPSPQPGGGISRAPGSATATTRPKVGYVPNRCRDEGVRSRLGVAAAPTARSELRDIAAAMSALLAKSPWAILAMIHNGHLDDPWRPGPHVSEDIDSSTHSHGGAVGSRHGASGMQYDQEEGGLVGPQIAHQGGGDDEDPFQDPASTARARTRHDHIMGHSTSHVSPRMLARIISHSEMAEAGLTDTGVGAVGNLGLGSLDEAAAPGHGHTWPVGGQARLAGTAARVFRPSKKLKQMRGKALRNRIFSYMIHPTTRQVVDDNLFLHVLGHARGLLAVGREELGGVEGGMLEVGVVEDAEQRGTRPPRGTRPLDGVEGEGERETSHWAPREVGKEEGEEEEVVVVVVEQREGEGTKTEWREEGNFELLRWLGEGRLGKTMDGVSMPAGEGQPASEQVHLQGVDAGAAKSHEGPADTSIHTGEFETELWLLHSAGRKPLSRNLAKLAVLPNKGGQVLPNNGGQVLPNKGDLASTSKGGLASRSKAGLSWAEKEAARRAKEASRAQRKREEKAAKSGVKQGGPIEEMMKQAAKDAAEANKAAEAGVGVADATGHEVTGMAHAAGPKVVSKDASPGPTVLAKPVGSAQGDGASRPKIAEPGGGAGPKVARPGAAEAAVARDDVAEANARPVPSAEGAPAEEAALSAARTEDEEASQASEVAVTPATLAAATEPHPTETGEVTGPRVARKGPAKRAGKKAAMGAGRHAIKVTDEAGWSASAAQGAAAHGSLGLTRGALGSRDRGGTVSAEQRGTYKAPTAPEEASEASTSGAREGRAAANTSRQRSKRNNRPTWARDRAGLKTGPGTPRSPAGPAPEPLGFKVPEGSDEDVALQTQVLALLTPSGQVSCDAVRDGCGPQGRHSLGMDLHDGSLGRCALVGPSVLVLGKEYGAEIDAHDTVIRMGGLPVVAYSGHVGRKTDIVLLPGSGEGSLTGAGIERLHARLAGAHPRLYWIATPAAKGPTSAGLNDTAGVAKDEDAKGGASTDGPSQGMGPGPGTTSTEEGGTQPVQGRGRDPLLPVVTDATLTSEGERGVQLYELLGRRAVNHKGRELGADDSIYPSLYFQRLVALLQSRLCESIDLYGFAGVHGPDYTFVGGARDGRRVASYVAGLEYFVYQLAMANDLLCLR
eukprot:jgi/Mesvir1/24695/Mv21980-RA.1